MKYTEKRLYIRLKAFRSFKFSQIQFLRSLFGRIINRAAFHLSSLKYFLISISLRSLLCIVALNAAQWAYFITTLMCEHIQLKKQPNLMFNSPITTHNWKENVCEHVTSQTCAAKPNQLWNRTDH